METIDSIVGDQNVMVERLSQMLRDAETPPRFGEFPMEYTDMHDLDIDYLIGAALKYQQQDIECTGTIADQLQLAPAAQSLAEEALGMAKGHLDSLREMVEK